MEVNLTSNERLILHNQFLILEKLYPAGGYGEKRIIVENGYKYHYPDLFFSISDEELSLEDSKFVLDVLEMHRGIYFSNRKLGNIVENAYFKGFDGNNENALMNYAKFFVFDLDRYEELQDLDFNSHSQMKSKYQHMLSKWMKLDIDKRYSMSKEEIEDILNTY